MLYWSGFWPWFAAVKPRSAFQRSPEGRGSEYGGVYRAELHKRALQWERSTAYVFAEQGMWELKEAQNRRGDGCGSPKLWPTDQLPVQTESGLMPTHHRFRRDRNEGMLPSGPKSTNGAPASSRSSQVPQTTPNHARCRCCHLYPAQTKD